MPEMRREGPVWRQLRSVRRRLPADRPGEPVLGVHQRHADPETVGAVLLQAVRPALLRIPARLAEHAGPPAAGDGQQGLRMAGRVGREAGRLGHLARRALLRHPDPRCAGQVLLRVAGRAGGLPRLAEELLRQDRRRLRRVPARPGHRADPLHRQGHRVVPHPVLAGDAEVRRPSGDRQAEGERARPPDGQQ